MGRWIGRDSAGEQGGLNLYLFARHSPIDSFDSDGRWPSSLSQWTTVGAAAATANTFYNFSSTFLGPFTLLGLSLQANAATYAVAVNKATSGALFQNVGGVGTFLTYSGAGFAMGCMPGFSRAQSLGYAVVSGRLSAVAAVGQAAGDMLGGISVDPSSTVGQAYSLIHDSARGILDLPILMLRFWAKAWGAMLLKIRLTTYPLLGCFCRVTQLAHFQTFPSMRPKTPGIWPPAWRMASEPIRCPIRSSNSF